MASMKLLISGPTKKVLFAEAGKEVVDFLFSLLAMPLGSIVKLLKEENMVGCIGGLYKSLQALEETYLQSKQSKDALLSPTVSSNSLPSTLLLTGDPAVDATTQYYRCPYSTTYGCYNNFTAVSGTRCPKCGNQMTTQATLVGAKPASAAVNAGAVGEGGCVKGVVTYTIMDDLTVTPMSSISSIILLNKFKVKDLSSLYKKTVTLGLEQGLELLKASLESKTVLTDIFMHGGRHL